MFSFKCREDWRNCRLCMRNDLLLIPLFELSGELTNLAKTIKEMLQFEVSIEDKYPTYVCCKCSDKLWEFKDFKEKCNVVKINVDAVLFNESNCTSVQRNPFVIKYEAKDVKREVLWAEKEIENKVPKNYMESHISVFKNLITKEEEEEPQDCNSSTLDNYEVFMESISPETMEEDCKMDIECNIPSSELDEVTIKEEDTREEETHTLERKILVQSSVAESLIKPPSPPKRCEEKDVEPCYSHVDMGSKHSFHCVREPVGVLLHQQQSEVKSQNVVEIPEINSMIKPENSLDLAMSRETLNGSPSCEERRNVFGEKGSDSKKEGKDIRCMHCNLMFNSHLDLYNHFPIHDDTVTWCCGDCGMKSRFFKDIWKDILSHKEAQKQKETLSTSKPNSNPGKICKNIEYEKHLSEPVEESSTCGLNTEEKDHPERNEVDNISVMEILDGDTATGSSQLTVCTETSISPPREKERKILVQSSVAESLIKPPSPPKRCEEKDVEPCYSHVDMGSKHSFHCVREPVGVLLHQQQSEVKSQNVVEIPEINSMIKPENSLDLAMSRETLNGSPSCEERRNVFGEKGSDSKKEGKDIRCMHCNLMFNSHLDLYNHFPIHDDAVTWCCGDCGMKSRFFKDIWKDILSHKEAQKQKETLSTSKPNSNPGKICKVCKKKIPILSSFRLHVLSHSKKNKWVCPHCKKNFSGQESLLTHIECHKKV